tara:strand:- start:460 stop:648 length:189 start_codon:yes stop_codon:yes gene_type:complete
MEFTDKALLKAFEQFVMEDEEKMTFGYFKGYLCKALLVQEMERKQEEIESRKKIIGKAKENT